MAGILCEHCTAVCCQYIALPIETPEQRSDFDDIRWYLLHEGISVFVEEGEWYINVAAGCRQLLPDYRCRSYARRPRICRKYTSEQCDYHSGDYGWEQHFTCPEHLDEYLRASSSNSKNTEKSKRKRNSKKSSLIKKLQTSKKKRNVKKDKKEARAGRRLAAARTDTAGLPLPALESNP